MTALLIAMSFSYVFMFAGQGLDTATTLRFMHTKQCVESNPIFGPQPSVSRVVTIKATTTVLAALSTWLLEKEAKKSGSKFARRLAIGLRYFNGGIGAYAGVHNIVVCGW